MCCSALRLAAARYIVLQLATDKRSYAQPLAVVCNPLQLCRASHSYAPLCTASAGCFSCFSVVRNAASCRLLQHWPVGRASRGISDGAHRYMLMCLPMGLLVIGTTRMSGGACALLAFSGAHLCKCICSCLPTLVSVCCVISVRAIIFVEY